MTNSLYFLISLTNGETLIKCALKTTLDLPSNCITYPMEPENKQILYSLLPEDIRSFGNIVAVEEIDQIVEKEYIPLKN